MILSDLAGIRSSVEKTWSNHLDGSFDLAASSAAMNTACVLRRNLIEDMLPVFKDYGGPFAVCDKFFVHILGVQGYDTEKIMEWATREITHDYFYDIADGMLFYTGRVIMAFSRRSNKEDEFIRGIKETRGTRGVNFFLIFAAQIILDVHHVMRHHASQGVDILMFEISEMNEAIESHPECQKNLETPTQSKCQAAALRELQKGMV
ncbi:hypothetical protein QQZ08_002210 [Neonectria magnoliae]|uniref:DUF6604 domain-containing protein n=1 Tax=Neonectria magnoliae TaxID=2732573 RepID=A0ABR1ICJ6_9HYPO